MIPKGEPVEAVQVKQAEPPAEQSELLRLVDRVLRLDDELI